MENFKANPGTKKHFALQAADLFQGWSDVKIDPVCLAINS